MDNPFFLLLFTAMPTQLEVETRTPESGFMLYGSTSRVIAVVIILICKTGFRPTGRDARGPGIRGPEAGGEGTFFNTAAQRRSRANFDSEEGVRATRRGLRGLDPQAAW